MDEIDEKINYYEEFFNDMINIEWKFDTCFNKVFLLPETFNKMFDKLSFLRRNNMIDPYERSICHSTIKLGMKRYYEFLAKKQNQPRKDAQKFIGKKKIRQFIFNRDKNSCLKCGETNNLQIDHIKSIHQNGENKLSSRCNVIKRDNYKDYRNGSR